MTDKERATQLRMKSRYETLTPEEQAFLSAYQQSTGTQRPVYSEPAPSYRAGDTGSFGWAVLGFIFPLVGLILWLVWHDGRPMSAKRAGHGALAGMVFGLVFSIIITFVMMHIVGNAFHVPLNDTPFDMIPNGNRLVLAMLPIL